MPMTLSFVVSQARLLICTQFSLPSHGLSILELLLPTGDGALLLCVSITLQLQQLHFRQAFVGTALHSTKIKLLSSSSVIACIDS